MKKWTKLGIGIGALVLAIAAGTGAYAMRGDGDGPAKDDVVSRDGQRHAAPESDGDGGNAVSAMCAPGFPDCVDVVVDPSGDEAKCAADGPCDMVAGGNGECPPDMACIEPWLMDPPVCPDGVPAEDCGFVPYPCATVTDAGTAVAEDGSADEGGAVIETMPMPAECEPTPVEPCEDTGGARCLPPDCAISSDGSVACPDGPAPECPSMDPAVSCMAPGSEPSGGVDGGEEPQFDPARE